MSKTAPGLDIKAEGGYIVVAPSVHESGKQYAWIDATEPVPAPEWLLNLVRRKQGAAKGPVVVPPRIDKGNQHTTLFQTACSWRETGMEAGRSARMKARGLEPKITAPAGDPPEYLTGHAAAKLREIATVPEYGQSLNASHRETLAHYCLLHSRFVEDVLNEQPMTTSERPIYHSLAMQLGRAPAAQSKISAPAARKAESP